MKPGSWPRAWLTACALLAPLLVSSCADEGVSLEAEAPPSTGSLRIRITLTASDSRGNVFPLRLGSTQHETEFGNPFTLTACRFLVSHVGLDPCDGNASDFGSVHSIDVSSPSDAEFQIDGIERGHYCDLVLTLGLDDEANVTGALPPKFDAMAWPADLGGGYHALKLEGNILDVARPKDTAFGAYLGRVQGQSHFFEVRLSPHLNISRGKVTVVELIMDVNQWFKEPHTLDLQAFTVDTHDDAQLQQSLQENGANVFGLGAIRTEDSIRARPSMI